jgi:hypothetical protein
MLLFLLNRYVHLVFAIEVHEVSVQHLPCRPIAVGHRIEMQEP